MDFYREEMMKMVIEAVSPESSNEQLLFVARLMSKTCSALCDKIEGFTTKKDPKEKVVRREQLFKSTTKSPLKTITNDSEKENWSTPQKLCDVLEKTPTPNKLAYDISDESSFKTPEKFSGIEEINSPSPSLIRKLASPTSPNSSSRKTTIQNFNKLAQFKVTKPQSPKKNIFLSPKQKSKPPAVQKKRPSPPKINKYQKKMKQSTLKECLESRPIPTMDLTTHSAYKGGKTSSSDSTIELLNTLTDLDATLFDFFNGDLPISPLPSTSKGVSANRNVHNDTTINIKTENIEENVVEDPKILKVKKTILIETTQGREFDKVPKPLSPGYARKEETARKKADRLKLPGWNCPDCEKFYKNLDEERDADLLKFLKDKCSKHRYKYQARVNNTPEDFWDTGFPPTQECIRRKMILRDSEDLSPPNN